MHDNNKGCPHRPCCNLIKISHPTKGLICSNYGGGCAFYITDARAKELNLKEGLNENVRRE